MQALQAHYGYLPAMNAIFNGASAVLLLAGRRFIAQKRIAAHRTAMLSAFAASSIFLAGYLTYHFYWLPSHLGIHSVHFRGLGWSRPLYFALLISHTVLAMVSVPLILAALYFALRRKFEAHKKIVRWTYPIWLYVGVTGVVVYLMLYKIFPS